eukprot:g1336.t1
MISSRKEGKSGWIEDAADLAARVVFLVLPVTMAFNGVIGGLGVVKGCSMQPTLNPDLLRDDLFSDRIILDRWSVHSNRISRGDVVVLRSPVNSKTMLVKRVIALPGDRVRTSYGKGPYVSVPEGRCWIEGDNSRNSNDSNNFGAIPLGLIDARAVCVLWPPTNWKIIKSKENDGVVKRSKTKYKYTDDLGW